MTFQEYEANTWRLLAFVSCVSIAFVLALFILMGCGGTIHQPSEVCATHGGVWNVQIHYQGYPGEKQDTLCNDGFFKVEP